MTDSTPAAGGSSPRWLYAFLLVQFACQVALILPLGPGRIVARMLTYGSSLVLLVALSPAGGRGYPARAYALLVLGITAAELLHPGRNTALSALAQVALTVAVWAPVFWAGRVRLSRTGFERLLVMLWGFNVVSAGVGVLQTYDERFVPQPEFVIRTLGADYADQLKITLNDGTRVYRPMGLSDTPGGAATAGAFAVLAGLGLATVRRGLVVRAAAAVGVAVGVYALLMCQVRATLVMTGLGAVGIVALPLLRGEGGRAAGLLGVAVLAGGGGFAWATAMGESAVLGRLESLTEGSAGQVYYSNRGHFLETTLEEHIPDYPAGAGLGRYGMMFAYFGDQQNPDSPGLWAEIQITAWVFDGGVPLLLAGLAATLVICLLTARVALTDPSPRQAALAAVVFAADIGVVATMFASHVFGAQVGLQFCLLNAALYAASGRPARAAG